jgi:predicted transcriptional regulator
LWEIAQVSSSQWNRAKVGDVAHYNLPRLDFDTDLAEVVRLMNQQQRHHLVVIVDSDGAPAGLITRTDTVSALSVEDAAETETILQSDTAAKLLSLQEDSNPTVTDSR